VFDPFATAPRQGVFDPFANRAPEPAPQSEYEGFIQEFAEGAVSGLTKIPQGIIETGTSLVDLARGTDYASDVTEAFEDFRRNLGIDPTGVAGAIGEVGTQFVLPAGVAAKVVGSVSRAGRLGTFMRQLGAAGAVDAVVATNDTTTLGDFFEGGPTATEEDIGLQGEQEAARRLMNKLRVGAEGALGVVAAPLIVGGVARAGSAALEGVQRIPLVPEAARAVRGQLDRVGAAARQLEESIVMGDDVGPFRRAVGEGLATLRYRGILPEQIAEARSLIPGITEAEARAANRIVAGLDKKIEDVVSKSFRATGDSTPFERKDLLNSLDTYLTSPNRDQAEAVLSKLPKPIQQDARLMRSQIDELSQKVLNSDFIQRNDAYIPEARKNLSEIIRANLGSYMRRRYRVFEDPNFKPSDEVLETALQGFMRDPQAVQEELATVVRRGRATADEVGLNQGLELLGPVTEEQARLARDAFLQRYQRRVRPRAKTLGRTAEQRLRTNVLISRKNLRDYQQALLGKVDDPLENYVATVADLAEFSAVDDYFRNIRQLAETQPGMAKLFRNTEGMSEDQIRALTEEEGYTILGSPRGPSTAAGGEEDLLSSGWGSLHGFAVPDRVYRDLTRSVIGDAGWLGNSVRSLYSGFLRAKGLTQYSATVLSPITQIRNVTTAAAFAGMQGNVGRGVNLFESMRLVGQNLSSMPKDEAFAKLGKLQRLGVINSQAELRELQELISRGFDYREEALVEGLPVTRRFGSALTDNPIGRFVRGAGQKAEDLYQAGDDLWKVYNFDFERTKLQNALERMPEAERAAYLQRMGGEGSTLDDFLDAEAARVVRNTVPNYNLAPEAIKALRKLPVGNFIAFPYEILRTGMNTFVRALDELADPSVEIQKIGLRRLTGALTTTAVLPATLTQMGYMLSGVSKEEMEAYQRSIAPPWERNARLIPTGRQEDGTPQYINYSYSNPYDMLERTLISAMNRAEEGRELGQSAEQIVLGAGMESLNELFAPFTEESIIAGRIRDVLDPEAEAFGARQLANLVGGRAGQTITGGRVYNPEDSAGDKVAKSFNHIIDALLPAVVPVNVSGGEFEAGRFARSLVTSMGLNEELGISAEDRRGIERDITQEIFRAISGVTESDILATDSIKFKGFEFSAGRRDASNIFNRVARRPNVQRDDLLAAYEDANNARYRVFNRFHQTVEDLRTFGMKDRDIRRILDEANVGGIDALMAGRYEPLVPSDVVLNEMSRLGTIDQYPRAEIRQIVRAQRGREFGEPEPEVTVPAPAPAPVFDPFRSAPLPAAPAPAPVFDPFQQGSLPVPTPMPLQPSTTPLSPTLLGETPAEQAANMQIAQATGRV
jgi:hypothetical protein